MFFLLFLGAKQYAELHFPQPNMCAAGEDGWFVGRKLFVV